MPRRGECIYKRKDGRWEARYVKEITADGRKKYGSIYAHSYRIVKEKQRQMLQILPEQHGYADGLCVSDMMYRWLAHIHNRVKPSTLQKYESLTHNHILPELGNFPLQRVTRTLLEEFAERRVKNGRVGGGTLSRKTVNDILIVLGLAMEFAEEEWHFTAPKIQLMREEKREARVLSPEEQRCLTALLLENMDIYKFGILLALYTGIRVGELCALQWEDITGDCLYVSKTVQRLRQREKGKTDIVVGSPKSSSSRRRIPLPAFLQPYVAQFRMPDGYVIRTQRRERAEPRSMQFKFGQIAARCGLTDVTFHTLRHTFATRCIESGFDVKTLSEILGHADVKTTLNRYVHSSFELKRENMDKLSFL